MEERVTRSAESFIINLFGVNVLQGKDRNLDARGVTRGERIRGF
jgi:hypothetical protein